MVPGLSWWEYLPWSVAVNSGNWVQGGRKMSRKLAALELIEPLLAIVAGAELLQGRPVRMWVDNSGSCNIWKHGYSGSCKISTTVIKAVAAVAAVLACKLDICKISQCSNSGAEMVDSVSKADFGRNGGRGSTCWVDLRRFRWSCCDGRRRRWRMTTSEEGCWRSWRRRWGCWAVAPRKLV